ncbi:MAG: DUF4837 family protein [Paludibacteraceae bacterium]|nr:DUF4837 family protein [Paludibacteraceae bacterium]
MRKYIFIFLTCIATLTSCKDTGNLLPSVTGTIYENLVVMETAHWKGAPGDSVRCYLASDMECMPQIEPLFSLSHTNFNGFSSILKPVRNIFIADIDSTKYTQGKISYYTNQWAKPQAVVKVAAPNTVEFESLMHAYGKNIAQFFVKQEIERQIKFYEGYTNQNAHQVANEMFGIKINIPNDIAQLTRKDDFLWVSDYKGQIRKDIVIYSYPYTDAETFTKEYLLAKRDSIMKQHIHGSVEGSYMGTEYRHIPPQYKAINVKGEYCAEIRGLWRMMEGDAMGGPFISHTRLDAVNQRIITAEVFIYGAGQKKRNALRQLEAVLYSMKLPQDINSLPEIEAHSEAK